MFISPINQINPVNSVNRNAVQRTQKASMQPSFKQENYAKVFNNVYYRYIDPKKGLQVGDLYKTLRDAALNMRPAILEVNFKNIISQHNLYKILASMDGFIKDDGYKSFADMVERNNQPYPLVLTADKKPVLSVCSNGDYQEDNALSRLIRNAQDRNPDVRDFDLAFYDLKSDRTIVFGLDYQGDWSIYRSHSNSDTIENMETFYMPDGMLKQKVKNGIVERYNMDGSKWDSFQWGVDDVEQSVRKVIKTFFG